MVRKVSFSELFGDVESVKLGEYTVHASGALERNGVTVKVGGLEVSKDGKRFTVKDEQGRGVVTELMEARPANSPGTAAVVTEPQPAATAPAPRAKPAAKAKPAPKKKVPAKGKPKTKAKKKK